MLYGDLHIIIYIYIIIYSVKWCNLDAIIYYKNASIVNVIRLKLFTLINIVYKYDTLDNVYYLIGNRGMGHGAWHAYVEGIGIRT